MDSNINFHLFKLIKTLGKKTNRFEQIYDCIVKLDGMEKVKYFKTLKTFQQIWIYEIRFKFELNLFEFKIF